MLTFKDVQNHPQIRAYIARTEQYMKSIGYTDHGFGHVEIVARRARELAVVAGLAGREQELAAMAGWCHDMGNFLGRTQHHYWAALLFTQSFQGQLDATELVEVAQAIAAHDKDDVNVPSKLTACLVIADKSDVRSSRVFNNTATNLIQDIHDRVNHAVSENKLLLNTKRKTITLKLKINTKQAPVMEYFEIFSERMAYCRHSAKTLGCKFELVINNFRLL
ncbi:MAG: HD domain-containing protein [Patescibacteria group bacterium]